MNADEPECQGPDDWRQATESPLRPLLRAIPAYSMLLLLAACGQADDPTMPQPDKVYRDGFGTPLSAVTIEAAGGTVIGAYDAWLAIAADEPPRLRHAGDYRPIDCGPVVAYLERELALAGQPPEAVPAAGALDCRELTNEGLPFDNGRWVAEDRLAGRLYYRVWKHSR
jgi:hypothetical protein